MVLLAIDSSTQTAGLALFDGSPRAELSWQAGRRHSSQLLTQIARLLELVSLDVEGLSAIAVARGPGSYTGLRVGLSMAQGLALALRIPAYGISTLDVMAAGQEGCDLPIRPLLDAGRKRFATALYRQRNGRLMADGEPVGVTLDDLVAVVDEPTLVCGELDEGARRQLGAMLGDRVRIASPAASWRRPAVLAQLAWERFIGSALGDPAALEPLYLAGP